MFKSQFVPGLPALYPMKKLKIFIVAISEPLSIDPILKWLIEKYHNQIAGVSIVPNRNENESSREYYWKILQLISPIDSIKMANMISAIKLKELFGRSKSVNSLIKKYNIPLVNTKSVNDPNLVSFIKENEVDLIFSFCMQIFRKDILDAPKIGVVNKHCSLLPDYRGAYPLFWQLFNNVQKTGTTLHLMDEDIDGGQLLVQNEISLLPGETMFSAYSKCNFVALELIQEVVDHYEGKKKLSLVSNKRTGKYYPHPKKEDLAAFYKKGLKLI